MLSSGYPLALLGFPCLQACHLPSAPSPRPPGWIPAMCKALWVFGSWKNFFIWFCYTCYPWAFAVNFFLFCVFFPCECSERLKNCTVTTSILHRIYMLACILKIYLILYFYSCGTSGIHTHQPACFHSLVQSSRPRSHALIPILALSH